MISSSFLYPFFYITTFITAIICANYYFSTQNTPDDIRTPNLTIILIIVCVSFLLGFRSWNEIGFGDTPLYYRVYHDLNQNAKLFFEEPGFNFLMVVCKKIFLPTSIFFTLVAFCYMYFQYKGTKLLLGYNSITILLFVLTSFSFLGYGVNGIRNGLGCSLVIYSIPFICKKGKLSFLFWVFISAIAISIHTSSLLPVVCCWISRFIIKDLKTGLIVWGLSILLSVLTGRFFVNIFTGLGFDQRLDGYLLEESSKGFRWDFLLYSMVPVVIACYIRIKKYIRDRKYELIMNTYLLSNAVWILIITASFSNRFAYLSWFLYPVVICYPWLALKPHNWKRYLAYSLLVQCCFTFLMYLIGK